MNFGTEPSRHGHRLILNDKGTSSLVVELTASGNVMIWQGIKNLRGALECSAFPDGGEVILSRARDSRRLFARSPEDWLVDVLPPLLTASGYDADEVVALYRRLGASTEDLMRTARSLDMSAHAVFSSGLGSRERLPPHGAG